MILPLAGKLQILSLYDLDLPDSPNPICTIIGVQSTTISLLSFPLILLLEYAQMKSGIKRVTLDYIVLSTKARRGIEHEFTLARNK